MLTIEEYEAKREARYNRLIIAADKAENEGKAARAQSDRMSDCIPIGQPILIGHYSEKRDRNFRKRMYNKMRKGFELAKQAEEYRSRAESVEANNSIFSDDPQAVEKLDSKLDGLLQLQTRYKAINKAHTAYLKDATGLDRSDLSNDDKILIRNYKPQYSWEPHPIPPYRLTNLSANIRQAKQRAEIVEKKQAIPDKDEEIDGIKIEWRAGENRIRVYYPGRVDLETFKLLKQHGFRVLRSEGEGAFSAYYNNNAAYFIKIYIRKESQ